MVCEVFDKVPPDNAEETLTLMDAFPMLLTNDTEPLLLQVTKIFGFGVPLAGGFVIVPPDTLHDIDVPEFQFPLIVY